MSDLRQEIYKISLKHVIDKNQGNYEVSVGHSETNWKGLSLTKMLQFEHHY